jgi:hypothetical protein
MRKVLGEENLEEIVRMVVALTVNRPMHVASKPRKEVSCGRRSEL